MQSIHHMPAQSASNPAVADSSPEEFFNRPANDNIDRNALIDSLHRQGFTGLLTDTSMMVICDEHMPLLHWVMVSLDAKQYENQVGRMICSCVIGDDLGGRVPQVLDEIRASTHVPNGMWLATEATMERPGALGFGMILNANADESELKAMVLEVDREATRGAGIIWNRIFCPAAGGSVSFAL